jgi:hypothetical protein
MEQILVSKNLLFTYINKYVKIMFNERHELLASDQALSGRSSESAWYNFFPVKIQVD